MESIKTKAVHNVPEAVKKDILSFTKALEKLPVTPSVKLTAWLFVGTEVLKKYPTVDIGNVTQVETRRTKARTS